MSLHARRVTLPTITPLLLQKRVIKVYNEDNISRALEVSNDITAANVCQMLIQMNNYVDDHNWTMFEQLSSLRLERIIEDHEMVIEVQSKWDMEDDCRFCIRKYYAKYEFFRNPQNYFPDLMLSYANETNGANGGPVDLVKMFLSTSTYPEIHSHLYMAEKGKKSWKRLYFILRRSGLYFSTKGTSKEPRHLQFFSDFTQCDVYMVLSGKKSNGAPTDFGFCLKPNKTEGTKEMKLLCAETEENKICWLTAIRLYKQGKQIHQNYLTPQQKSEASGQNIGAMRSISENSLVAMDFSGNKSRVVENPAEALSIALQEGLSWRKKSGGRINLHGSNTGSQNSGMNLAIHLSQPWFHHRISRDEAQKLIVQQGLANGLYLVRDSQSIPKAFVLTLCYGQKIRHFQISPIEDGGKLYYTLDDGQTKFTDLTQVVEFHQLNRGILPCTLKHYCTRVTL